MTKETADYVKALDRLAPSCPFVVKRLREAQQCRTERISTRLSDKLLDGLEELYSYLELLEAAYNDHRSLAPLAFLIRRAACDFETALEATLSGYPGVAADAMRDVMEMEQLLLDFGVHEGHAAEWLTCDRKLRLSKYGPSQLRKRLKAARIPSFADGNYRAHSEALHVIPREPFVGARGFEQRCDFVDVGFIEIFAHAKPFVDAAEMFRHVRLGVSPDDFAPLAPLDQFYDARDRSLEMQARILPPSGRLRR